MIKTYCRSGVVRVEKLLQQLIAEHQSGLRESSVISVDSIKSAEEGDEEVWYQIRRELEDVGVSSEAIREHREFITNWIKGALIAGNFHEGDANSCSSRSDSEPYEAVTISPEKVRESILNTRSVSIAKESERFPGDVPLCSTRRVQYACAESCHEPPLDTFSTWFELLMHVREYRCELWTPTGWADNIVRDEENNVLSASRPDTIPLLHYDYRNELVYVLAILQGACKSGSMNPAVPQLMYDLYYSRKCLFSHGGSRYEDAEASR